MVFFDPEKYNPFNKLNKGRQGMGAGLGKGYHNLTPLDPTIHSMSSRGVRVKRLLVDLPNYKVFQEDVVTPDSPEFLELMQNHPQAPIQEIQLDNLKKVVVERKSEKKEVDV
jgi:hypothetical protein